MVTRNFSSESTQLEINFFLRLSLRFQNTHVEPNFIILTLTVNACAIKINFLK